MYRVWPRIDNSFNCVKVWFFLNINLSVLTFSSDPFEILSLDRKKCPKKFRLQFWSINDGLLTSTAVQKWKTRSLLSKWPVVNIIWPQVITHAASCRSTDCSGANKSIYLSLQYPRHWTSNCMTVWPIIRS